MRPEEFRDAIQRQPFEPFRLVLSDGGGYDVRHPELMMVGQHSVMVGLTDEPGEAFYERSVKIDRLHISRLEPLETIPPAGSNGQGKGR